MRRKKIDKKIDKSIFELIDIIGPQVPDGFWCSYKLYAHIEATKEIDRHPSPWHGLQVYADPLIPNNTGILMKDGKPIQWFEIDWGLH